MAFDPNKTYAEDALPSGSYLLAMTTFERKLARKDQSPYLRARFAVIAGPCKGKSFFSSVGIDVNKGGVASRLAVYAKAVGQTDPFDLDDDSLDDVFVGKPFKATVKTSVNGQYTNNDVEKYVLDLTAREVEICDAYWNEFVAKGENKQSSGAYDDDGFGGGAGTSSSPDGDDDIPF